jgi:hypothetical protein
MSPYSSWEPGKTRRVAKLPAAVVQPPRNHFRRDSQGERSLELCPALFNCLRNNHVHDVVQGYWQRAINLESVSHGTYIM